MPSHRYRVVDVFTNHPLEGNALAVFPNASDIDGATMQKIAKELSLPETVFLLPPSTAGADARLRIFTPSREMDFAGHPTIGASFVLLDECIIAKGKTTFFVEERVGLVPIRVEQAAKDRIWLTTPPITFGPTYDRQICADHLGLEANDLLEISPQLLNAGNPTIFVGLKDKAAVDRAWLDGSGLAAIKGKDAGPLCAFVFAPTPEGAYSRMFAPEYGIAEDPATGSSTGPLFAYMMRAGLIPTKDGTRVVSEQGTKMGRRSILHVEIKGDNGKEGIDVGGDVTPLVDATMHL